MAQASHAQLTLGLFDTASPYTLSLDGQPIHVPTGKSMDAEETDPAAPAAATFRLAGERGLAPSWRGRATGNLQAIRLLQAIEQEGRAASAEEQAILARFTGFGSSELANHLFRRQGERFPAAWAELGLELERLVTPAELAALARSTQYAHYTPEYVIRALWAAVQRLGFAGGSVLEPGCGTGLFLALVPEELATNSRFTGIEAEPITARIARLLFPAARIRREDFTRATLAPCFDLVIGNPPFSDRTVRGPDPAGRLGLALHDWFIARSLELLRPGGVAAFVTSRWTMDKRDSAARRHLAEIADLLAAVRLPEGALRAAAGIDVVVDLLFLRKREAGALPSAPAWQELAEALPADDGEEALRINEYFLAHPALVLGRHARSSSAFGPTYTCAARDGEEIEHALAVALATLPQDITPPPPASPDQADDGIQIEVGTAADGATLKEGSYLLSPNGTLLQIVEGRAARVTIRGGRGGAGIPARHARIIKGLIPIRDAVREILRAQAEDAVWGPAQSRLRLAYHAFVRVFGAINLTTTSSRTDPVTGVIRETQRRVNLHPFQDDPESQQAQPGPIFRERVLHPPTEPLIVTAADALAVTLHECGLVDVDRIAELLGRGRDETLALLGEAVFQDPQTGLYETADSYLSGPVRGKLAVATAQAALDAAFTRNVAALERVQPRDLAPSQITARLGAPWIPAELIERFVAETLGITTRIRHTVEIACWSLDLHAFEHQGAATSEWGTSRRHAGLLLDDALNARIPQIWDTWIEDGHEKRELNTEATEAAKEKLGKLKAAFEGWVWTDAERAERLARIYNDRFNNLVPRHFDGSHLQLPGASNVIGLYPHQKRVIWRIIATGATYIAHAVGAGKTFSITAAIMEQKRLGLITKAMLVVPGHCLAQASREFLQLYPNASILVADESNFAAAKRLRFLARAATAGWDCIIITHSAFKLIPSPTAFERDLIRQHLASYGELLERVDGDDRLARKRIERLKEGLEARLDALRSRKDDMVTIAWLGVDQLIVDEAQEFRKLSFATNMTSLKGVDPEGSQRAWDLLVKARFIAGRQPARPLILASGTPITNTLGELYSIQRFLQPDLLAANGLHEFDAWAASFGETRTELELQPSGRYKPVTRFCEFVNVPELIAMFRTVADVMLKDDLRPYLRLPRLKGGARRIVTAPPSAAFKAFQRRLEERIKLIEQRKGRPEKGDDILLSVITDGRHAAIDLRLVDPEAQNEPENKLNLLIASVHRIWRETAARRYRGTDGRLDPLPGAGQLVFSDLGTLSVEASRGFSAYRWIKQELVALGVPAGEIAYMQDHKTSEAKQRLFAAFDAGRIRVLIGSSPTMGTGVNVQRRLIALHHLDVPWLPSEIEQREGRIERQGNAHEEIEILTYATLGSMDAPMWQTNERKARFIEAALAGDASLRRLEDAGNQTSQFALAKAIASGDARLMQKAGLESEIARLARLRAAHFDDQLAIRREIARASTAIAEAGKRLEAIQLDLARRIPTRGDAFAMQVAGKSYTERKAAGAALLMALQPLTRRRKVGRYELATLGGFGLVAVRDEPRGDRECELRLVILRAVGEQEVTLDAGLTPLGVIARLEHQLDRLDAELLEQQRRREENERRLADYLPRQGQPFALQPELDHKLHTLAALEADLAADEGERAAA
jgi:N12 class adenine-specific DNA methylase